MSRKEVLLVRYGEIGLKGKNRRFFEKSLVRNLRRAVKGLEASVEHQHGRLLVRAGPRTREALNIVTRVFGVVSASPALEVPLDMESIEAACLEVLRETRRSSDRTFRVSARRSNKSFGLNSQELNIHLGAHILKHAGDLQVDLARADLDMGVEIRDHGAYVYACTDPGPGGLPVGTGGRGLLLLSGGIDSPVAGWLSAKRGLQVNAVHFESFPFTGPEARQKAVDLARLLSLYTGPLLLHLAHFTEVQKAIARHCPADLITVIMRRQMMRIAGRLASGAGALITGESIGQVASQTLEALACTDQVASLPVIRPLITFDKTEIIELAKRIGSYDISIRPYADCCTLFVPRSPRTRPRLEMVEEGEKPLDLEALVAGAVERTETLRIQEDWDGSLGRTILS